MNTKQLLLASIVLAILTMGVVSAHDNQTLTTDTNTADTLNEIEKIDTNKISSMPEGNVGESPNIQVPERIWKYGDDNITIETDKNTQVEITGAVTYNATVNGKESIPIGELQTGKHSIEITCNSTASEYNISVLKENSDWNIDFDFLEGEKYYDYAWDHESIDCKLTILNMPEGLTDDFTFYQNGVACIEVNAQDPMIDELYHSNYYEPITYNFTLKYSGDDYYHAVSKTKILNFTMISIGIPEYVLLGYDDEIYIKTENTIRNGYLIINIDNQTVVKKEKINSYGYYYIYSLNKLQKGQLHDIEVIFSDGYEVKTKRATVEVDSKIRDYVETSWNTYKYVYGNESNRYIIACDDLDLNISIDQNRVAATYDDGFHTIDISGLSPGHHTVTISYDGDERYAKNTFSDEFEVVCRPNDCRDVNQNEENHFTLNLPKDAVGKISVDLKRPGDDKFTFLKAGELENGSVNITLPTDHVGNYQFRAYFNGNYEINEIYGKYLVRDNATWEFKNGIRGCNVDENFYVTLKMQDDGMGNLTVFIKKDGKDCMNFSVEVINGKANVTLPSNHIGEYTIKASFEGNHEVIPYETKYYVDGNYYIDEVYDTSYKGNEYVTLTLPKNATGKLTLEIKYSENDTYAIYESVELINGSASIKFPTDKVGIVHYNALYIGNYEVYNITDGKVTVLPSYTFKNNVITLLADNQANGTMIIEDNSNDYRKEIDTVNGAAKLNIESHLKQINKPTAIGIYFKAQESRYEETIGYKEVKPIYDIKIVAKDVTMYYGDTKYFQAKIYRNGKTIAKGEKVTVQIGTKKYNLKTDKNGIVKVKITQTPKKYTVKITYKTKTLKKKATVKQVLTLKTAKIKKSAKKLILKATLKKGKKAIKGKTIKFKFKGKTYKAKTNSKGLAKVTIKKSVLKKLKVGKKITYQATYLKTTVKKTAKVKK